MKKKGTSKGGYVRTGQKKSTPATKHFYGGISRTGGNRVNRGQSMKAGKGGSYGKR